MHQSLNHLIIFLLGFAIGTSCVNAQVDRESELFKTLKAKDSLLFVEGFNKCNLQQSTAIMADDLEFYHDKSGITRSKQEFKSVMEEGICNPNNPERLKRFLVEQSLTVYPLYDNEILYGVLQTGVHYFSTKESIAYDESDNEASFSHLWLLNSDKEWIIKRVVSYNHRTKPVVKDIQSVMVPTSILESYAGNYLGRNTGEVLVTVNGNDLQIKAGQMNSTLKAISNNIFSHPEAPLTFEFVNNEDGSIEKFLVREDGKIVEEAIKQ